MPLPSDLEFSWFRKKVRDIAGVNLDSYRAEQMKRLLDKMLEKTGRRNYVDLVKYLQESPAHIQEFRDSITINVSSLFRDHARWMELNTQLVTLAEDRIRDKALTPRRRALRVWSAGCSIGAEPYTIAMLMQELNTALAPDTIPFHILATDIDRTMLQRARDGVFTDRETREVPPTLLKRYFSDVGRPDADWARHNAGDRFYEALPSLKDHVEFRLHNMLDDAWDSGFDLIVCRNVIIYFTNEIKMLLFKKFHGALNRGGLLFIGGTEIIFRHERLNYEIAGTGIYRKAQTE